MRKLWSELLKVSEAVAPSPALIRFMIRIPLTPASRCSVVVRKVEEGNMCALGTSGSIDHTPRATSAGPTHVSAVEHSYCVEPVSRPRAALCAWSQVEASAIEKVLSP